MMESLGISHRLPVGDPHNLLANEQNGFRPDRSCLDHIFTLCDLLRVRKSHGLETFCAFVDFQKAFDYVNHDFLFNKLLNIGVTGKIYNSIKAIYEKPTSCVLVHNRLTDWFDVKSGVRQGDSLSPTLFSIFINDLAQELHGSSKGIDIISCRIPILMYADDIVILTNNLQDAQYQMDIVSRWCERWGMKANIKKSQVVHHRNPQRPRCQVPIALMGENMLYVSDYKYLGCWVNEHDSFDKTVDALTSAAGRSYGRIVGLFKKLGDMGYYTFSTLYRSYILSVANYAAGVWGFKDYQAPRVLQNRVSRYYLGVHKFAAVPVTGIEMGYANIQLTRWQEMLRLHNRIINLKNGRLPKEIYRWETSLGSKGWLSDVKKIARALHLPPPNEHIEYDMENVENAIHSLSKKQWWEDAQTKSKLDSYIQFRKETDKDIIAKMKLSRKHRSMVSRLAAGILPIQVEIGCYTNVKRELRFCKVCQQNKVEDEAHFLFDCPILQVERELFYDEYVENKEDFKNLPDMDKITFLINKDNVKKLGIFLESMLNKRRQSMFIPN